MHAIIRHLDQQLGALDELLLALSPERYIRDQPASIGSHVRHCLDHLRALLNGHATLVRYDQRLRGTEVEQDPEAAVASIRSCRQQLVALVATEGDRAVIIEHVLDADGTIAQLTSSLARELVFVAHHMVHHEAMIRPLVPDQSLDPAFGVAPATILARGASCAP